MLECQAPPGKPLVLPTLGLVAAELSSQPFEIFQRPEHARNALVVLRTGLELIWQLIGGRANLVSLQLVKQIILPIECPGMRAKEFSGGAACRTLCRVASDLTYEW